MKKIFLLISGVLLFLALLTAGIGYYFVLSPNTTVKDDGIVFIRAGDSFETVLVTLRSKGYVKNENTLRRVATLKGYPQTVKPGRYEIKEGWNNNHLVNVLRSGNQSPVHFTFNNIRTPKEFAGTAGRQLNIDSVRFLSLLNDADFSRQYGFTPQNFIGMFIPNTYQIFWNISAEDFVKRMNREYKKFWNENRMEKARKAGLSPMDVIIIASIVEEETNQTQEYPTIAGVYINRLKKGWKLEACPTLKFALGDFSLKRVLEKHMETESPYNTYKYAGLPPGPVRMPSIQVIDAVLGYQHHDYMFFCAKSDFSGTHHFSRTLRQHNRYAAEYHRALNRRKIY